MVLVKCSYLLNASIAEDSFGFQMLWQWNILQPSTTSKGRYHNFVDSSWQWSCRSWCDCWMMCERNQGDHRTRVTEGQHGSPITFEGAFVTWIFCFPVCNPKHIPNIIWYFLTTCHIIWRTWLRSSQLEPLAVSRGQAFGCALSQLGYRCGWISMRPALMM